MSPFVPLQRRILITATKATLAGLPTEIKLL